MSSPLHLASEVAALLDRDPILARQLKEHLSEERLCELLEIEPEVIQENVTVEVGLDDLSSIVKSVPLANMLEAYRLVGVRH